MFLTCSKECRAWDLNLTSKSIEELFSIQTDNNHEIYDINFVPNSRNFVLCDSEGIVTFYDLAGKSKGEILFKEPIYSTNFDLDGKYMVVGGDLSVALWNIKSNQLIKVLGKHKSRVNSVSFSINKTHIASASDDGDVMLHNIENYKSYYLPINENIKIVDSITKIKFSPLQERVLAHCGDSGNVSIWDTARLDLLKIYNSHSTTCNDIIFNPKDKNSLCSGGLDKKMVIYDLNSNRTVDINVPEPITSLDFKKDGITIAVGSHNGSIFIYDLRKTKKPLFINKSSHEKSINSIKWNPYEEFEHPLNISSEAKIRNFEYETKSNRSLMDNILSPIKKVSSMDLTMTPEHNQNKVYNEPINYIGSEKEKSIFSPVKKVPVNTSTPKIQNDDSYFDDIELCSPHPFSPERMQTFDISEEAKTPYVKESNSQKVHKLSPLINPQNSGSLTSTEGVGPCTTPMNGDTIELLRQEFNHSLQQMKEMMASQIQNLHLEMLRQFQIQQMEIQSLLAENNTNKDLLKEVKRLQEENQRLKSMIP